MKSLSYFIFVVMTTWLGSEFLIHKTPPISKQELEIKYSTMSFSKMEDYKPILDTISKNNLDAENNLKAAKITLKKLKNEHPINY